MRPTTFAAIAATLLTILNLSCSSNDDSAEAPLPEPSMVTGTVGAAGGVLTSADNRLTVTIPAGALSSDTQIEVKEIDPADAGAVFGSYEGNAALALSPRNLALAKPATVSFTMDLPMDDTPPAIQRAATQSATSFREFEIQFAWADEMDALICPEQSIEYDLAKGLIKLTVDIDYFGDIEFGPPTRFDYPQPGDDFSRFRTRLTYSDDPIVAGEPVELKYDLTFGDTLRYRTGNFVTVDPPGMELSAGEGQDVESIIDELSGGFMDRHLKMQVTPPEPGDVKMRVGVKCDWEFQWGDENVLVPPLDLIEDWGNIKKMFYSEATEAQVLECFDPPCDIAADTLGVGMTGLEGLGVAYADTIVDPPPRGTAHPWLFVAGAQGVKYFSMTWNGPDILYGTEEGYVPGQQHIGAVPASAGEPADPARLLFAFGESGAWRTHWNRATGEYGAIVNTGGNIIRDGSAYGGDSHATGVVWCNGAAVRFLDYDSSVDLYYERNNTKLDGFLFPEATGFPTSAFVDEATGAVLVVMDGAAGQIWYHEHADVITDAFLKGTAQSDPRQIRALKGVFAISNHASDTITLGTWDGWAEVEVVSHQPVGDGPVGIDMLELVNGNIAILTTGSNDDTYTIVTVDTNASVVDITTAQLNSSVCDAPKYAVFLVGESVWIAISCHDSGVVQLKRLNIIAKQ